jgi:hypothetical protein
MFMSPKHILILQVRAQTIYTTADQPFFVQGRGWTDARDLHVGDQLRAADGKKAVLEAITPASEQAVVYQMDPNVPPFPFTGLWPAGTMLETAEGLKPIEEIEPGDRIVFRKPFDPEQN